MWKNFIIGFIDVYSCFYEFIGDFITGNGFYQGERSEITGKAFAIILLSIIIVGIVGFLGFIIT